MHICEVRGMLDVVVDVRGAELEAVLRADGGDLESVGMLLPGHGLFAFTFLGMHWKRCAIIYF